MTGDLTGKTTTVVDMADYLVLEAERDCLKAILATIAACGVEYRTRDYALVQIDHETLADLHAALEGRDE